MFTVLCHFYNEEYLLPWWLKHHKKMFGHGIMINYASTDRSVDIIKEICPTWEIVNSRNVYFEDSAEIDREIMELESKISGFKMTLNTTEFLVGNMSILKNMPDNTQFSIAAHMMISEEQDSDIINDIVDEHRFGVHISKLNLRNNRSLHNFNYDYLTHCGSGRHLPFNSTTTDKFCILYYSYAPFNKKMVERKVQFKRKVRPGFLYGHDNIEMSEEYLINKYLQYRTMAEDLSDFINSHL